MCVCAQAYNALCLCGTKTQLQKNTLQDRIADRIAAVHARVWTCSIKTRLRLAPGRRLLFSGALAGITRRDIPFSILSRPDNVSGFCRSDE
jgi:hypothetical protein